MQLLAGHPKIEGTIRYFGIEVDDARERENRSKSEAIDQPADMAGDELRGLGSTDGKLPRLRRLGPAEMLHYGGVALFEAALVLGIFLGLFAFAAADRRRGTAALTIKPSMSCSDPVSAYSP